MAILLQRICWNSNNWRGPTGELFGKEDSYVGTNGVGHEEWNFNTSDLIGGKVYGYSYYNPPEGRTVFDEKHNIYFYTIRPDRTRLLVGYYKQARFLKEKERKNLKKNFGSSEMLQKRVDELLALNVESIKNKKEAKAIIFSDYGANIEVDPQNVFIISPPKVLTREDTGGTDPVRLNRYTNPKFIMAAPRLPKITNRGESPDGDGVDLDLIEDAYTRFTKAQKKVIYREHNQLSNRFKNWLLKVGATNVKVERNAIDVNCRFDDSTYLFELKICYQQKTKFALREALGQILEYRYFPGRKKFNMLAIVIDQEPSQEDVLWLRNLKDAELCVELFWSKGEEIYSAGITEQPLVQKAKK